MPEIVEIRKYADFITRKAKGKELCNIIIKSGRYKKNGPFKLYSEVLAELPAKILGAFSKGKFMYIKLEGEKYIGITLGLSGGWFYGESESESGSTQAGSKTKLQQKLIHGLNGMDKYGFDQRNAEAHDKYMESAKAHINVEFVLSKGSLYFYDQLSFGTISFFSSKDLLAKKLVTLGLDIANRNTSFEDFKDRMMKGKYDEKYIGNLIVNQKIIAGIGNYLRADVLWMSKISPFRKMKDVTEAELKKIFNNIRILVWGDYNRKKGIRLGIMKASDKIPADYDVDFFVYNKSTDINGKAVSKEQLYEGSAIRYIYWVKEVQR